MGFSRPRHLCTVCHKESAKPLIHRYQWCDACNKYRKLSEYFVERAMQHPDWDSTNMEAFLDQLLETPQFCSQVNAAQRAMGAPGQQVRVISDVQKYRQLLLVRLVAVAEKFLEENHQPSMTMVSKPESTFNTITSSTPAAAALLAARSLSQQQQQQQQQQEEEVVANPVFWDSTNGSQHKLTASRIKRVQRRNRSKAGSSPSASPAMDRRSRPHHLRQNVSRNSYAETDDSDDFDDAFMAYNNSGDDATIDAMDESEDAPLAKRQHLLGVASPTIAALDEDEDDDDDDDDELYDDSLLPISPSLPTTDSFEAIVQDFPVQSSLQQQVAALHQQQQQQQQFLLQQEQHQQQLQRQRQQQRQQQQQQQQHPPMEVFCPASLQPLDLPVLDLSMLDFPQQTEPMLLTPITPSRLDNDGFGYPSPTPVMSAYGNGA